jgi:AcrR family transcriptional regulator
MAKRATYHHGDLRRALLDASLALVDEVGIGAISLREVARKAGVSHNAPYHHFPDKSSLLAAIAEEGFGSLAKEMGEARAAAGTDPRARLNACGLAYIRFAVRAPTHFRVMFRPELMSPNEHPGVVEASNPAMAMLLANVVDAQEAGMIPAGDPTPFVLTCWSCVHGLATLWLDGPLQKKLDRFGKSIDALALSVVATISGLLASAAAAPAATAPPRASRRPAKSR